jgi:thiaminase/transcriptional activator TenA
MIYQRMCDVTQPLLQKIHTHPFNIELATGCLPWDKFIFYLVQDSLYLSQFARALALTFGRLSSHLHQQQFIQFTLGAIQSEQELHAKYLNNHHLNPHDLYKREPSPTCFMYTNYLLNTVALAPIEESVASLLPCFVIYYEVGKKMLVHQHDAHPYHDWIALYAGDAFEYSVLSVIEIINELGDLASIALQEKMIAAFIRSTQLEWLFWQSAYNQEQWII